MRGSKRQEKKVRKRGRWRERCRGRKSGRERDERSPQTDSYMYISTFIRM